MVPQKITIICLILAIALLNIYPCHAQNTPQDFVKAHNEARAQVSVPPLEWDNALAAYAQNYAKNRSLHDCQLRHSGGPHGENLAEGYGSFSGIEAVKLWVNEKGEYDHKSNSCTGKHRMSCFHYTQVVWRNSRHVGCAREKCNSNGAWFIICSYDPPGNVQGQSPY